MSINFPLILVIGTFLTGLIALIDILFFMKKRKEKAIKAYGGAMPANLKLPKIVEYSRSFFPVLLIVLIIRSFIIQPMRVPTGSLEPTILPGDFIAVTQYNYGLKLPVLNTKIVPVGEPKRGDIVVFRFPDNPDVDFVKRVVGLPGDHLVYQNKVLYINGQEMKQTVIGPAVDFEPSGNVPSMLVEENLDGVKHQILIHDQGGETQDFDVTVPAGMYFMMGDNRDNSSDSRYWGFVPEKNLQGQAFAVWLSWDSATHSIRWHRIGTWIE